MTLSESISDTVAENAGVIAAFGLPSGSIAPIYPVRPPKADAFPYVVWHIVSAVNPPVHSGQSMGDSVVVQFSTFAETYTAAERIRKAIRTAIDGQTLAGGEQCTIEVARDLSDGTVDMFHLTLEAHVISDPLA